MIPAANSGEANRLLRVACREGNGGYGIAAGCKKLMGVVRLYDGKDGGMIAESGPTMLE
jgi:hypothetical protein